MKPAFFSLLPLCLLLAGCDVLPYPRELESTMLIGTLGVDWGEEVNLTAAETVEEREEARVLTASGETLEAGKAALKRKGEEYVALTHVTQLVIGEGSDLRAVLEGTLAEREVGQTATVWLAEQGSARALLTEAGGGARRLNSIELNYGMEIPTVLEALARLEESREVRLPALRVENGTLELAGEILWKEEGDA